MCKQYKHLTDTEMPSKKPCGTRLADAEIDDPPDKPRRKRKKKDIEDSSDENYPEEAEADAAEQARRQIALEQNIIDRLEADAEEYPFEDDAGDEEPERKKLKRELRAEALARLEKAARTQWDFEKVIACWDKLDANRERRERYHELSRSGDDVPLEYGASANELFFPDTLNDVLEKQQPMTLMEKAFLADNGHRLIQKDRNSIMLI